MAEVERLLLSVPPRRGAGHLFASTGALAQRERRVVVYFGLPVRCEGLRGREGFQAGKERGRGWLARRAHHRAVLGRPHPRSPPLLPPDQDRPQEVVGCEGQALHRLPPEHPDRSYGRSDSQALRWQRGDGSGRKGGQEGARDREQKEEELLCPRGVGVVGTALTQPACLLQGVAARGNGCPQAGDGEAPEGGFGDAGRGEEDKEGDQALVESAGASFVGGSTSLRHWSTFASEPMASHFAQNLGDRKKRQPERAEMLICAGLGREPSQTRCQAGVTFTACRPFFPWAVSKFT